MANGKIGYSKPELLDIGGVGEVTSGQGIWCYGGSDYWCCGPGSTASNRGCTTGTVVGTGCHDGTNANANYGCFFGDNVHL